MDRLEAWAHAHPRAAAIAAALYLVAAVIACGFLDGAA